MSWFILPLLLSDLTKEQRKDVIQLLLPTSLPGAPATKLAFAAITAERQVKKRALFEQKLLQEAVAAGGITSVEGLKKHEALHSVFNKLPASVQGSLFSTAAPPAVSEREVFVPSGPDSGTSGAARPRSNQPPTQPPVRP